MNIGFCTYYSPINRNDNYLQASNTCFANKVVFSGFKGYLNKDTVNFSGSISPVKTSKIAFNGNFFYDKIQQDSDFFNKVVNFNEALTKAFKNKADEAAISEIIKKHFPDIKIKISNHPEKKDLTYHLIQFYEGEKDPEVINRLYVNLNKASQDNVFDAVLSIIVNNHIDNFTTQFADKLKELSKMNKLNIYQVQQLVKQMVPDRDIYINDYSQIPERSKNVHLVALTDQAYSYNGVHKDSTIYVDFNSLDQDLIPVLAHEFSHALQAITLHDNKLKIFAQKNGVDFERCDKAFRYFVDECFYNREVTDITEVVKEAIVKYNLPDNKTTRDLFINFAKNEAQAHFHQYKQEKITYRQDTEHLLGVMKQLRFMEHVAFKLTQI
ncbi:MAG: hypothetical protein AB1782_03320 [Cyanobacteriota bacterium]